MSRAEPLLGAHMSVAGGVQKAVGRAVKAGCTALQIFVKNPSQWEGREPTDDEISEFGAEVRRAGLSATLAHSSYLINLASPDRQLWTKSKGKDLQEDRRNLATLRSLLK